ncbi:hypothetical protein ACFSL4_24800 [Streptomyces caeni]|uniref:Uncharacterized protein n=1 Tax=Streptomyces caeni TaxID=2307231 RepID=A0ABW4IWK3_9ACTN
MVAFDDAEDAEDDDAEDDDAEDDEAEDEDAEDDEAEDEDAGIGVRRVPSLASRAASDRRAPSWPLAHGRRRRTAVSAETGSVSGGAAGHHSPSSS